MKTLFLMIAIGFGFCGCATFRHHESKDLKLDNNLKRLEGSYENASIKSRYRASKVWRDFNPNHLFYREIDRSQLRDTMFGKEPADQFTFRIVDKKHVEIKFSKDGSPVRNFRFKYREKNGYLYLKNKNFKSRLVPFLFGGLNHKRLRFAVDSTDNINVQVAEWDYGAAFLILFGGGNKDEYSFTYNRIVSDNQTPRP